MFIELSSARVRKIHSKAVTFIQPFHFLLIIFFEFKSLLVNSNIKKRVIEERNVHVIVCNLLLEI